MAKKAKFEEINTGRDSVLSEIDKAAEAVPEKETKKTVRTSMMLNEDTFEYMKNIGAKRFGTIGAYIDELVKRDREAWRENEEKLRELLSK